MPTAENEDSNNNEEKEIAESFGDKTENKEEAPKVRKESNNIDRKAIVRNILSQLGRPTNLTKFEVRPCWDNRFRVNVVVGNLIVHSYFIKAAPNGDIIESNPKIERRYV